MVCFVVQFVGSIKSTHLQFNYHTSPKIKDPILALQPVNLPVESAAPGLCLLAAAVSAALISELLKSDLKYVPFMPPPSALNSEQLPNMCCVRV